MIALESLLPPLESVANPKLREWMTLAATNATKAFRDMQPECGRAPHEDAEVEGFYWLVSDYVDDATFSQALVQRRRLETDGPLLKIQGSRRGMLSRLKSSASGIIKQLNVLDEAEALDNPVLMTELAFEQRDRPLEAAAMYMLRVDEILLHFDGKILDDPVIRMFHGLLLFKAAWTLYRVLETGDDVDGLLKLLRRSEEILTSESGWHPAVPEQSRHHTLFLLYQEIVSRQRERKRYQHVLEACDAALRYASTAEERAEMEIERAGALLEVSPGPAVFRALDAAEQHLKHSDEQVLKELLETTRAMALMQFGADQSRVRLGVDHVAEFHQMMTGFVADRPNPRPEQLEALVSRFLEFGEAESSNELDERVSATL